MEGMQGFWLLRLKNQQTWTLKEGADIDWRTAFKEISGLRLQGPFDTIKDAQKGVSPANVVLGQADFLTTDQETPPAATE